ncbi:nuclear receptor coactivator 7 isoform X4 [Cydia fagiglandana]|uniref:nuclear receptor coactivator 7 isoform X4 n=1 Tax=Cydia fagiglandana TaxID=1458189 RepID=UPI002FEE244E
MMSGSEPTLTEPPVPLALARLQGRPAGRAPRGLRSQRPSLPLASLQESIDETPRRFSDEPFTPDTDDDEAFSDMILADPPRTAANGRRASDAAFAERYRQLSDFDGPPPDPPRRASLSVSVGAEGFSDKGRRRSWAARLQLERKKRRKSGGGNDTDEESDTPVYIRQKRPSWWNVFVPDNIKNRSRRASQQLSRSAESIDQSFKRSKSRSVDHGFAAAFELDSLRSKVEDRFNAVHRDEDEHAKRLPPPPPIKTITYTVRDRDTLTSLAARFDTTPSELTKLNRLATQFIFPGQRLLVPDKKKGGDKDSDGPSESGDNTSESTVGPPSEPAQEKEILDSLRPVSPEAPTSSSAPQRFLKINVRHITDGQGVVSGVLLVTPNAVMFDPNVSDTLVMEHGPESYGVIAPMEYVVNAAIFYDIAHMRTHGPDQNTNKAETAEIYYMNKSEHSPGKDSLLVKDETFPELQAANGEGEGGACDERPGSGDPEDRGGAAFPKAFERELVTPTALQQQSTEERRKSLLDHHWAIPSKDRMSIDQGSESDDVFQVSSSTDHKEDGAEGAEAGASVEATEPGSGTEADEAGDEAGPQPADALHLVKLSYHDSGIDIRDPLLHVTPAKSKKVYSDADIVLSAEWVPPVCLPRGEPPLSAPPLGEAERAPRKPAAVSFSLDGNNQKEDANKPDKKNKMLKRLSYPLSWVEGLTGEGAPAAGEALPAADTHNTSVFSKVFNSSPMNLVEFGTGLFLSKTPSEEAPHDALAAPGRSSLGGFGRATPKPAAGTQPRLDYRSMVSVDDMPDLFASFDKLIPRPARPSDDPPLYLRLRMGKPAGRPLPRTTPLMSYGRKRMKPEYWFGVPRNRVDDLFKFLTHWVPDRYGPLGDVSAQGFELIDSDTEWDDDDHKPHKVSARYSTPRHRSRSRDTGPDRYGSPGDVSAQGFELIDSDTEWDDDDHKPHKVSARYSTPRHRSRSRDTGPDRYGSPGDVSAQGFELIDSDTEWDDDDHKPHKVSARYSTPRHRSRSRDTGPDRYGSPGDVSAQGFELIDSDTEWDDDDHKPHKGERTGSSGDVSDITRESWEVLSMSDELRRALYSTGSSLDMEFSPPDLIGTSEIFTMEHREKLCSVLPARAQGYMWSLAFSTSQHGFSLASMYRKMQRVDSPVLLVIQDTQNNVFGALTSCALHPSEHFYGTGESLLFSFQRVDERRASTEEPRSPPAPAAAAAPAIALPDVTVDADEKHDQTPPVKTKFKYWGWTGDNMYFIRGSNDNISIGAGDGKFGLWLDGDLYLGRTQRCTTYGNEPLTTREDFIVKIMECWTFI